MKNSKYSQYFIDIDDANCNIREIISEFIANIYMQTSNIKYNYVFFWQGVSKTAYKNIVEVSNKLSLSMHTSRVKSSSDYVVKTDPYLSKEVINMLLKSHTLNTLFVASKKPLKIDNYLNSTKNPIASSNLLDSFEFTIYVDLDWCININSSNKLISKKEVIDIFKENTNISTSNIRVREEN